jgi:hypothetical protein
VEVEDVFFPVGLPGAELDDELGRVVVAAAVELAVSVFDVASLRCDLWNQSYHDTSRSPTRSIDAISSWDGAIVQSSLLQNRSSRPPCSKRTRSNDGDAFGADVQAVRFRRPSSGGVDKFAVVANGHKDNALTSFKSSVDLSVASGSLANSSKVGGINVCPLVSVSSQCFVSTVMPLKDDSSK